jgi:hypothetical protein
MLSLEQDLKHSKQHFQSLQSIGVAGINFEFIVIQFKKQTQMVP